MKKISIIIAVYNIENYIRKCLDSVISLDGDDIEILIVDDGSSDNSLKICKEYQKKDKRIRIIHQENKGLSSSRNVGIDNAKGEYIWFIDGDDYLPKNALKPIRKYLDKYDIICFNYNNVYNDKVIKDKNLKKYDDVHAKYILSFPSACNKVFKRKLFNNDRFPEDCCYNDVYIIPTLATKTDKIIFIDDCLYNYVYRDKSLSHSRKFNLSDSLYCLEHVYDTVYKKYPDAALCYYVNNLLIFNYAKAVKEHKKYDFKKLNKILKNKFPKYYKNKYFNTNLARKIYIRLVYMNMSKTVLFLTYIKLKLFNNYFVNR